MGIKFKKNHENEKPKHIAFLCHMYIVSIQVDRYEQGLDIFKTEKSMYRSTPNP